MRRTSLVLVPLLTLSLLACGSDDPPDAGAPSTSSPTTTAASAPSEASTTSAPPSTAPPTTLPPAPVRVLVVGDSVGYTLGEHFPGDVPSVISVEDRALPGCGLLTSGERPPDAVEAGAPPRYDDCAPAIVDADAAGLATDPDVVLLVTGAWERADHVRDGRTVGPGDDAWAEEVRALLQARVETLSATGAPVALWADACGEDADDRTRQDWYRDEVVIPVAEATQERGTTVIDPTPVVCRDGLPVAVEGVGDPRPDDGQHWSPAGAAWLWRTWLGEQLAAAAAA